MRVALRARSACVHFKNTSTPAINQTTEMHRDRLKVTYQTLEVRERKASFHHHTMELTQNVAFNLLLFAELPEKINATLILWAKYQASSHFCYLSLKTKSA